MLLDLQGGSLFPGSAKCHSLVCHRYFGLLSRSMGWSLLNDLTLHSTHENKTVSNHPREGFVSAFIRKGG